MEGGVFIDSKPPPPPSPMEQHQHQNQPPVAPPSPAAAPLIIDAGSSPDSKRPRFLAPPLERPSATAAATTAAASAQAAAAAAAAAASAAYAAQGAAALLPSVQAAKLEANAQNLSRAMRPQVCRGGRVNACMDRPV